MSPFARQIGPREPGTRYLFGYSGQTYLVVAVVEEMAHGWRMTVEGQDGSATEHCTPWDAERDRLIS